MDNLETKGLKEYMLTGLPVNAFTRVWKSGRLSLKM